MRVANKTLLTSGDMSGNITSDKFPLNQVYGYSIAAIYTGSPVGSLKLQGSNDPDSANVTNWDDIDDSAQAVSGAGIGMWNYNGAFYLWVRVVYTFTSGSGLLNLIVNSKGN